MEWMAKRGGGGGERTRGAEKPRSKRDGRNIEQSLEDVAPEMRRGDCVRGMKTEGQVIWLIVNNALGRG